MKNYPTIDFQKTGERIREIRLEKGITIADMCSFFGVSKQSIYKWERGDTICSIDNMFALSHLFEISINEIIVAAQ